LIDRTCFNENSKLEENERFLCRTFLFLKEVLYRFVNIIDAVRVTL